MVHCCKFPFERLNIEWDGSATFCCPAYNNEYYLGNVFDDDASLEDMWFGEKAQEFRKSILDGSYKYCNLNYCAERADYNFRDFNEKDIKPEYPRMINLSYVSACNARCVTCRDKLITESKEDVDFYNKISDRIVNICKKAEIVYLNGSGEAFVSKHFNALVHRLAETYPKIRFHIQSNGLLFDEKHVRDFGLEGRLCNASISVHAATKKTYEKIVRGGHWEQLQKNLEYLSKLRNQGQIWDVSLIFVFHSLNYKEMPAFVKMAKKYGAIPHFWRFRNWDSTEMCKNYEKYTCWDPKHKDYKKFLKVLNKLKRMDTYYRLDEEYFRKLQAQTKDPLWIRVVSKLKKLIKNS